MTVKDTKNHIAKYDGSSLSQPKSVTPPKILWDEVAVSYDIISQASKAHIDKINMIADLVIASEAHTLIDLGCGSGVLEKQLFALGFSGRIEALDASDNMLKIAKETTSKNKGVNFHLFDLNDDLDFKEGSFDCAVAMNVMFYLKNPHKFLKNISRVLTKEGKLILINPKPKGRTRDFIKEHLKDMGFSDILKELSTNFANVKHLIQITKSQRETDLLHKQGIIHYQSFNEINDLMKIVGFKIDFADNIQANQNWVFVAKKA